MGRHGPTVWRVCLLDGERLGSAPLSFSKTCDSAREEVSVASRLLYALVEASCETA